VKYATGEAGSWQITSVEAYDTPPNSTYAQISMVLDDSYDAHIAYADRHTSVAQLKYAVGHPGSWSISTIDTGPRLGYETSIGRDPSNKYYIGYHYVGLDSTYLGCATDASGPWQTATVDAGSLADCGYGQQMAVDKNSVCHIAYFDWHYGNGPIKYASGEGSSWQTLTIDDGGGGPGYCGIALDSLNNVYISYVDSSGYLKLATNQSGSWVTTPIDSSASYTSIILDSLDHVHISYYASGKLKYATNQSGSWDIVTVDLTSYGYNSIAIDGSNKPHIAYYTGSALKYAVHN